jgi:hypothetical protein
MTLCAAMQRLEDLVVHGVVLRVTVRSEEYAHENFDGMAQNKPHKKRWVCACACAATTLLPRVPLCGT